jgi:hypothetical protein
LSCSLGLSVDNNNRFTNIDDEGQLYGPPGGSGGYTESIFRHAAKALYGVDVTNVEFKSGRYELSALVHSSSQLALRTHLNLCVSCVVCVSCVTEIRTSRP